MIGADLAARALAEAGVELAFGVPGVHNLDLWHAVAGSPIRLVGVRHEQAAAYAADGYARATGRLGVALVTTGPGAANTLAGVGEAFASRSPVLVIATDIPTGARRPGSWRGALHETSDQAAMFAPVVKRAFRVRSGVEVGAIVAEAARTALAAPARPVYVEVPTDLLSQEVPKPSVGLPDPPATPPLAHERLIRALEPIERSRRPLVWAGGGAVAAGAGGAVARLAERLVAPVVLTYSAKGLLRPDHPCLVGPPPHVPEVGALWDEADVVIAIGTDLDAMMTQGWAQPQPPHLVCVNVDPEDASKNYLPDAVLEGDAAAATGMLADRIRPRGGLESLAGRLADVRARVRGGLDPHAVEFLDTFAAALPEEAVVVCDMCVPGYWLGGFHLPPAPRKLSYPLGWGTLGCAFGQAIGAALSEAGPVVSVTGDGGFLYACGELATAAQEGADLTAVVVDDGGYGMLRFDQDRRGLPREGVDLHTPDFEALAASFGVRAQTVEGLGNAFGEALERHLALPGPSLLAAKAALPPPPNVSPRWYRSG